MNLNPTWEIKIKSFKFCLNLVKKKKITTLLSMQISWHLKKIEVSELKEYEMNPRVLMEDQLEHLENSIRKFGLAEPLVVNLDKTICGGHGRKKILERLNITEVDCYFPNRLLTAKEFKELNVRLNKNIAGKFDFDILSTLFEIEDLKEIGFNDYELDYNLNDWSSDIESIGKINENLDGISSKIIITCPQDLKDEVLIYIKAKLLETSFEGVHVK